MNISYENSLGESITPQQVANVSDYKKIYRPANSQLIKKREHYRDNVIRTIDYYLDANETEDEAIAQLLPFNCSFGVITREYYGSYTIENANHYVDGALMGKTRQLFNADGLQIGAETTNLSTGLPDYQETAKFLGEYNDAEFDETIPETTYYCQFHYNADGSLDYCEFNYMSDYDSDRFDINTMPWIKTAFKLSDEMYNYYLTADFLPPI
jgi:hypothetical protein